MAYYGCILNPYNELCWMDIWLQEVGFAIAVWIPLQCCYHFLNGLNFWFSLVNRNILHVVLVRLHPILVYRICFGHVLFWCWMSVWNFFINVTSNFSLSNGWVFLVLQLHTFQGCFAPGLYFIILDWTCYHGTLSYEIYIINFDILPEWNGFANCVPLWCLVP